MRTTEEPPHNQEKQSSDSIRALDDTARTRYWIEYSHEYILLEQPTQVMEERSSNEATWKESATYDRYRTIILGGI